MARHADLWNLPSGSVETYPRKLDILAGYCDAIGRDPATIVKTWETGCVALADSAQEARCLAEASPFCHQGGPEASVVGTPAMVAEHLDRYRALGVSHFILRLADFPRLDGVLRFTEEVAPALRRGG